jgi:dihydroorotate dehydrogenase
MLKKIKRKSVMKSKKGKNSEVEISKASSGRNPFKSYQNINVSSPLHNMSTYLQRKSQMSAIKSNDKSHRRHISPSRAYDSITK